MTNPDEQQKKGSKCSACNHVAHEEIDTMLLNGVSYAAVIRRMREKHPKWRPLTSTVLSRHYNNHVLTRPITKTVVDGDGQIVSSTYRTGHYEAKSLIIPDTAVPIIPSLPNSLKIIIAAGLHNMLNDPTIVSPANVVMAIDLLRKLGGNVDEVDQLLGAWDAVTRRKDDIAKKTKHTRSVTVQETVETEAPALSEWGDAAIEALAIPVPEVSTNDPESVDERPRRTSGGANPDEGGANPLRVEPVTHAEAARL